MKWYIEFPIVYLIMFCICYLSFNNNLFSGAFGALLSAPVVYLVYREIIGKPVKEPGHDKKITWKQWLLLIVIVMIVTFTIIFSIFLLTV